MKHEEIPSLLSLEYHHQSLQFLYHYEEYNTTTRVLDYYYKNNTALTTLEQSFFFTDPVTIQYLASTSSILQHTLHSTINGIHLFVCHGNLQLF